MEHKLIGEFNDLYEILKSHSYTEDYPPSEDWRGYFWEYRSPDKTIGARLYDKSIVFERIGARSREYKAQLAAKIPANWQIDWATSVLDAMFNNT